MHEKHLMDKLVQKAAAVCAENGAVRVTRLHVYLGALSHFTPEHFQEHLDEDAKGTVLDGAELQVTMGEDVNDPRAADVVLLDLEVEDAPATAADSR
jgi:hydrogenase nickel incorporation protein HypA/HybF